MTEARPKTRLTVSFPLHFQSSQCTTVCESHHTKNLARRRHPPCPSDRRVTDEDREGSGHGYSGVLHSLRYPKMNHNLGVCRRTFRRFTFGGADRTTL